MAIIGIDLDRKNPEYTKSDFCFWMPQFKKFMDTEDGQTMFDNLYPIANNKIFYSIFGTDWKYAMSLCIAHYSYLISIQATAPTGDKLTEVTGGGVTRGLMTSATIGGFSKSYDMQYTALTAEDALFWNQSSYGTSLYALMKTKAIAPIMVVTNGPLIPGNPSFEPRGYDPNRGKGNGGWPF